MKAALKFDRAFSALKKPLDREMSEHAFKQVRVIWYDSIGVFIDECVMGIFNHIDTAMSVASLKPLANRVRRSQEFVDLAILHAKVPSRKGYMDFSTGWGEWKDDQVRSAAHGMQIGREAFVVDTNKIAMTFYYSFDIKVFQMMLMERGKIGEPFLKDARDKQMQYLKDNLRIKMPKLLKMHFSGQTILVEGANQDE